MPMKNPPHPGHSINDACLDPLRLSVTEGAKVLGVARHTLSRVINGQAGISAGKGLMVERRPLDCCPRESPVEASYVGNRGTHLGVTRQLDNTPAQYLSRLPVRDTQIINFLSQVFPNPFNGTNPIYGTTTSRGNLLRPFPQFIIAALPWRNRWASPGIALQGAHRFNTN